MVLEVISILEELGLSKAHRYTVIGACLDSYLGLMLEMCLELLMGTGGDSITFSIA